MMTRCRTIKTLSILEAEEAIVLEIIQEYLNKNRYFNMNKILPLIQVRFRNTTININNEGIEKTLKSLIKKKLILEGSKLTKFDILSIAKRKMIFEYILKNPGTYLREIQRDLHFANHIIVWHLKMLLKFNFIKKTTLDNKDVYYHPDLDPAYIMDQHYLRNQKIITIINYLKNMNDGATKTNISTTLGIHINTVDKYLKILESLNLLDKREFPNKIIYILKSN